MKRPPFVPFDEHRAVRIYQRALPHWRQDGATYFVTFRLGDSIPVNVAREWEEDRRRWIAAKIPDFDVQQGTLDLALRRLSPEDRYRYHKYFNAAMHDYLDRGVGDCHLHKSECVAIVRSKMSSDDGNQYHVGDFVIMPNHVHVLIVAELGVRLENVLRRIKGASSRECNLQLSRSGRFWQEESYDHIVRSLEQLVAYREYIAANPEKAHVDVSSEALYRAEWMDEWFSR